MPEKNNIVKKFIQKRVGIDEKDYKSNGIVSIDTPDYCTQGILLRSLPFSQVSIKARTYSLGANYYSLSSPGDAVKTIPGQQQFNNFDFRKKVKRK